MAESSKKEKGKGVDMEDGGGVPSLEERLDGLNLQGEEDEDLDFSGELDELVKDGRWIALFRVNTLKPFSHAALFSAMRNAWSAAKEVTFKTLGPNLFLVQLNCLGDWTRVMEGSPWLFRGAAIVLEEYDGFSNVFEYSLNRIPVWTRIQGVPEVLMKRRELAEKVAKKVGEIITVVVNEGQINPTPYLRARVWLDLNKPLVRVVPITLKERKQYLVQYEKLPSFCFFCGRLGHEVTECGDGVHNKATCQWGDWLRIPFQALARGREEFSSGRGSGRGRGRGRGGGRGQWLDEDDDEIKNSVGEEENLEKSMIDNKEIPGGDGAEDMQVVLADPHASISPLKEQEKKRPRRDGEAEDGSKNTTVRSALSFEESGRAE